MLKFLIQKIIYIIYSDKITYFKNDEIIFTEGNSKAKDENNIK